MYSKEELLDRKRKLDERVSGLRTTLKEWQREAAATRQYRPAEEINALEREVKQLGKRSQRIQDAIAAINKAKPDPNHWFRVAASEVLTKEQYLAVLDRSYYLRDRQERAVMESLA